MTARKQYTDMYRYWRIIVESGENKHVSKETPLLYEAARSWHNRRQRIVPFVNPPRHFKWRAKVKRYWISKAMADM